MWLYYLIIIILKKYKKGVDQYDLKWYSITCPWDEDKQQRKKLLKKLLTKKNSFDKIKKLR